MNNDVGTKHHRTDIKNNSRYFLAFHENAIDPRFEPLRMTSTQRNTCILGFLPIIFTPKTLTNRLWSKRFEGKVADSCNGFKKVFWIWYALFVIDQRHHLLHRKMTRWTFSITRKIDRPVWHDECSCDHIRDTRRVHRQDWSSRTSNLSYQILAWGYFTSPG